MAVRAQAPWPAIHALALTFLRDIPRIRGAFLDTPPAVMLALDYLLRRPDVDTTRVISPRPFVMVNASGDERLPRPAIDALFNAAREPKEQVWMPGLHVHADRETIGQLVSTVMGA